MHCGVCGGLAARLPPEHEEREDVEPLVAALVGGREDGAAPRRVRHGRVAVVGHLRERHDVLEHEQLLQHEAVRLAARHEQQQKQQRKLGRHHVQQHRHRQPQRPRHICNIKCPHCCRNRFTRCCCCCCCWNRSCARSCCRRRWTHSKCCSRRNSIISNRNVISTTPRGNTNSSNT